MAALRRAPKQRTVKVAVVKPVAPLHRRILGRGATELDTIDDLRLELEKAYSLDQIEYDTYLDCCEALDIREAKAKVGIQKATGRYVKPQKTIHIYTKAVKRSHVHKWKPWQVKAMLVFCAIVVFKIFSFKP
jgi:hypothetical protein